MNNHMRAAYRHLLGLIVEKKLGPGDMLPTEKELAEKFNTTRMNIYRVFKMLRSHNLVASRKRAGTIVTPNPDLELASFLMDESNRLVYVLYSQTPRHIHWDNTSFEALESVVGGKDFTVYYKHIPAGRNREELKRLLESAGAAGVSAMVIFPDSDDVTFLDENSDLLVDSQTPLFILNRGNNAGRLDFASTICLDHFGDGISMGRMLRQNGFNHVLLLGGEVSRDFWYLRRVEGMRVGLKSCQPAGEARLEELALSPENCERAIGLMERDANSRRLAFVAVNNIFGARFMDFCSGKGLKAARDYDLLAFDDNPMYLSYGMTSLAVRVREIGEIFGRMICDGGWLKSFPGRSTIRLSSRLVMRSSCRDLKFDKSML